MILYKKYLKSVYRNANTKRGIDFIPIPNENVNFDTSALKEGDQIYPAINHPDWQSVTMIFLSGAFRLISNDPNNYLSNTDLAQKWIKL